MALASFAARAIWKHGSLRRRRASTRATRKGWVFGGTFGTRTAIVEVGGNLGVKAGEPLVGAAFRDAEALRHLRDGLVDIFSL